MKTVYLGMSGGVDSSVSAVLLKEAGYKVIGVYMKNWSKDLPGMKCPWAEDLADAKRVATKLDIDFEVWDFESEYKQKVVDYMFEEFKKGNTPNPDIMCNQEIKFKLFYDIAREKGADYIATGHYARTNSPANFPFFFSQRLKKNHDFSEELTLSEQNVADVARTALRGKSPNSEEKTTDFSLARKDKTENSTHRYDLLRAVDENKDQTYFLYRISEDAIAHTIFPIGGMKKPDVKKLADEKGLANAYKKESMGVCFVGEVGMKDFLKEFLPEATKSGEIREVETEKILGYHDGAIFYTIGQRHGLYVGGGLPYYVVKKDLEKNIVYVSKNLNNEDLWTNELELKDIINRTGETNLKVRLRHRAPLIPAKLEGKKLVFEEKIKRPAAGQSVVFYGGEDFMACIGGGIIR